MNNIEIVLSVMPKYRIDTHKVYSFPTVIRIVHRKDKILVIAPDTANWIVLESLKQLNVFELFRSGLSIEDVLNSFKFDNSDVVNVVTQIEARKFYKTAPISYKKDNTMHLYLTNKCNLRCPHCYMFSGSSDAKELGTQEIMELISNFVKIGNGSIITFSGGEPAIRSDFDEIVKFAYDKGLDVKLITNGTQLSVERVSLLSQYITSVQISIDGFSEESNSRIRGCGNFERALTIVDAFVSHGVYTDIAITPTFDCLKNHVEDYVNFAQIMADKYENKPFELRFSEELLNGRCISDVEKINSQYGKIMANIQEAIYGPDFRLMEFVKMLSDNPIISNCSFGNLAISAIGDVFLCPRISDLKPIGNIRVMPFEEILHKAKIAEQVTSVTKLEPCKNCDLHYICGGGCRIDEFPGLTLRDTFVDIVPGNFPRHQCDDSLKNKFYDFMILSNEYFYSEVDKNGEDNI